MAVADLRLRRFREKRRPTRGKTGNLSLTGDVALRLVHGQRVIQLEAKSVVNLQRNKGKQLLWAELA